MIAKSLRIKGESGKIVFFASKSRDFHYCGQNKPMISCVSNSAGRNFASDEPDPYSMKQQLIQSKTMKKGKTLTALVLVLEIATIAILHAVKINQLEKAPSKEVSRNIQAEPTDSKQGSTYSLAVFK